MFVFVTAWNGAGYVAARGHLVSAKKVTGQGSPEVPWQHDYQNRDIFVALTLDEGQLGQQEGANGGGEGCGPQCRGDHHQGGGGNRGSWGGKEERRKGEAGQEKEDTLELKKLTFVWSKSFYPLLFINFSLSNYSCDFNIYRALISDNVNNKFNVIAKVWF